MTDWEAFFASTKVPNNFEESKLKIKYFCEKHKDGNIALVTSGGTTVPLEHNTVRFVDNFSNGTRGASSTEYFLAAGYAVVFLFRLGSQEPFARHFTAQHILNTLVIDEDDPAKPKIEVSPEHVGKMLPTLRSYKSAVSEGRLLCVDFTSLSDYLWLLREASRQLACFHSRALLYLAAAVSDFYIPNDKMAVHKMQSVDGAPVISLQLVPKMLKPLVSLWAPQAFVVSFKLETDPQILISKARGALHNYKHKLVIGNLLHSRRYHVIMVEPDSHHDVLVSDSELAANIEIEEKIVNELVKKHSQLISKSGPHV